MHQFQATLRTADGEYAIIEVGNYSLLISLRDTKSPQLVKVECEHRRDAVALEKPFTITTMFDTEALLRIIDVAYVAGFTNCLSLIHDNGSFHWLIAHEMVSAEHHTRILSDWDMEHHEESGKHLLKINLPGKIFTFGDHTAKRSVPAQYRSMQGPISILTPSHQSAESAKDPVLAGFEKPFSYNYVNN